MLSQQFFAIEISLYQPWLSMLILQPSNIPLCLFVSSPLFSPACLQRSVFGPESSFFIPLAGMTVSYLTFLISRPHSHIIQMLLLLLWCCLHQSSLILILLMRSKQPFCIAFSVLVGLGMLVAPRVRTPTHQAQGTNYGFGWHTADIPSDGFVLYYKVQDSQHLL